MDKDISRKLDDMIKEERLKELASGEGKKARNARHALRRKKNKDGCPQGHPYDDTNTLYNAAGRRLCLICHRDRRLYTDRLNDRQNRPGQTVINLDNLNATSNNNNNIEEE